MTSNGWPGRPPRPLLLPVGARFPRSWPADVGRCGQTSAQPERRAPIFPVGCRSGDPPSPTRLNSSSQRWPPSSLRLGTRQSRSELDSRDAFINFRTAGVSRARHGLDGFRGTLARWSRLLVGDGPRWRPPSRFANEQLRPISVASRSADIRRRSSRTMSAARRHSSAPVAARQTVV